MDACRKSILWCSAIACIIFLGFVLTIIFGLEGNFLRMFDKDIVSAGEINQLDASDDLLQVQTVPIKTFGPKFGRMCKNQKNPIDGKITRCFSKCCAVNETIATNLSCREFDKEDELNMTDDLTKTIYSQKLVGNVHSQIASHSEVELIERLLVFQGIPCGKGHRYTIRPYANKPKGEDFFIFGNGSLQVTEDIGTYSIVVKVIKISMYCVDFIEKDNRLHPMAIVCYTDFPEEEGLPLGFTGFSYGYFPREYFTLMVVLSYLNAVVLLVVLIVYSILPPLRTLNGLCIMSLTLITAVASFAMGTIRTGNWKRNTCIKLGEFKKSSRDVNGVDHPEGVWRVVNRTPNGTVPEGICKLNPCLPKCCVEDELMNVDGTCREGGGHIWDIYQVPIFKRDQDGYLKRVLNLPRNHFTVLQGIPCHLGSRYRLDPTKNPEDRFKILDSGSLFDIGGNIESSIDEYCIDFIETIDRLISFVCFPTDGETGITYRYYPVGMLLSVVFLSATFLVYSLLPQLRNIHGLSLMCHVLSLTIGYIFLAVVQIGGSSIPQRVCSPLAYTVVFTFLASFFWLNIMCFDIWWVFSGIGRSPRLANRDMDHKKFIYYSIYSWGCPTVIIIIIVIMESPLISDNFFLVKPGFGLKKCWFQNKLATWTYFYAPVATILIFNLFFFVTTTSKILSISKETKVLNHGENRRNDSEKRRFVLYLKLFMVMGITWLAEVISFHYNETRQLDYLWYITDISNTLQGIPIFFIFVWKRKTLRLLQERFCPSVNSTGSAQTSTRMSDANNIELKSSIKTIGTIREVGSIKVETSSSENNTNGKHI